MLVPFQRVRGREDESSIVKRFAALRLGMKALRRTAHGVRKFIRPQLDHPEQQMSGLGISSPGKMDDRLAVSGDIHGRCPAGDASLVAESVDDERSTRYRRSRSLVVCSTPAPATEGGRKSGGDESLIAILHESSRMQDRNGIPGSYRRVGELTTVCSNFVVTAWSYVGSPGPDGLSSLVHRGNRPRSSRDCPTPRFPDFPRARGRRRAPAGGCPSGGDER